MTSLNTYYTKRTITVRLTFIVPQTRTSRCTWKRLHCTFIHANTNKHKNPGSLNSAPRGLHSAALVAPASCFVYLRVRLFVLWSKGKANTLAPPGMCEHDENVSTSTQSSCYKCCVSGEPLGRADRALLNTSVKEL